MCRSRPQITLRSYSLILLLIQYVYELILLILAHHLSGCKSRKLFFIIQIYFRKKIFSFLPETFACFFYETDGKNTTRSEEHTSELQSRPHLVCRLLLE